MRSEYNYLHRNMGIAFKHLGDVDGALKCNKEALTVASKSNLLVASKMACDNIAELFTLKGEPINAERYAKRASEIEKERLEETCLIGIMIRILILDLFLIIA